MIWVLRDDMGDDIYHPSQSISSLSTGMIWGMIWVLIWAHIIPQNPYHPPSLGSDIKPYQPSSLGIICLGLNHPWASVLLLIVLNRENVCLYVFLILGNTISYPPDKCKNMLHKNKCSFSVRSHGKPF